MNYQELDLKELQKLLDVKRLGINVSEDYYKLCKEFSYKRVTFRNLEQLNGLFEKFLGFCSQEQELRFDITPYGRGGLQKEKKELQGKFMHAMRSRTLHEMNVLRNSFHSASLKFDTELLKWKLSLNVNFAEEREGKEHKTFYTNYFTLGYRMLLTEEEVDADVFLSSLENSLTKASLDFSKKDLSELQAEIASRTSYSFNNIVSDNAASILKMEEEELVVLKETTKDAIEKEKKTQKVVPVEIQTQTTTKNTIKKEKKTQKVVPVEIQTQTTTSVGLPEGITNEQWSLLYILYGKNFEAQELQENEKLSYAKFKQKFKKCATTDSVKEAVAELFEIELFDLIE